jgi:hypothetical protein
MIEILESLLIAISLVVITITIFEIVIKLDSYRKQNHLISLKPINKIKNLDYPYDKKIEILRENIGNININTYLKEETFRRELETIFTSPEFIEKENIKINHAELEKTIEKIFIKFDISFTKETRVGDSIYDYFIYFKNERVPIELKVYQKRVIDNQLIPKLRKQAERILKNNDIQEYLLIILNTAITRRAKEELEAPINNKRLIVIQSNSLGDIEEYLVKYLSSKDNDFPHNFSKFY